MKIDTIVLGAYQTNSYVVRQTASSSRCLVVDTGLTSRPLVDFLEETALTPDAIILTHGHADHIAGVPDVQSRWPTVKLFAHEQEAPLLADMQMNLSLMSGAPITIESVNGLLQHKQRMEIAGIDFTVLLTPGHTPGSVSFYVETAGVVFAGDALFAESVGRTDFPGGDTSTLIRSIKEQLFALPDDTVVYPGHGPQTTIGHEKRHNPYLR